MAPDNLTHFVSGPLPAPWPQTRGGRGTASLTTFTLLTRPKRGVFGTCLRMVRRIARSRVSKSSAHALAKRKS